MPVNKQLSSGSTKKQARLRRVGFQRPTHGLQKDRVHSWLRTRFLTSEILVNATDNYQKGQEPDNYIKATLDTDTNTISIYNDGRAIPIENHEEEHKIYDLPE